MLPDLLAQELDVVICGTAVGHKSASLRQYYAKPGNKFWPTLYKIGLTPRILSPAEYRELLIYKVGLTDLVKSKSGIDSALEKEDFGGKTLTEKMRRFQPKYLCFNGKRAGKEFLQRKVKYGLQAERIGETQIFVAPSTSGAANRWWNINEWETLAEICRRK